ncbi:hypothetical protein JTE90_007015, partial [Oedothorax gibbosus]
TRAVLPWGPAAGIFFGPGTKITLSPFGFFKGQKKTHRTRPKDAVGFFGGTRPYPGRADSRGTNSYKENNSFPGAFPSTFSEFWFRSALWSRRTYLRVPGVWGKINPLPFGRQRGQKKRAFVCVWPDVSLRERIFSPNPLDRLTHFQNAVFTLNPSPSFQSSRLSLSICYLSTKICTGGGSRRAHAGTFHVNATATLYSLRRKPPTRIALP